MLFIVLIQVFERLPISSSAKQLPEVVTMLQTFLRLSTWLQDLSARLCFTVKKTSSSQQQQQAAFWYGMWAFT